MRQIVIPATLSAVSLAAYLQQRDFDDWLSSFDEELLVVNSRPVA